MIDKVALLEALNSEDPSRSLRHVLEAASSTGHGPEQLLKALEDLRGDLVAQDRSDQEDVVLDVMDRVLGWCAPAQRIKPFDAGDGKGRLL
jgi:hypothetical protein